ncbi:MAG: glycoside hydrolase family 16 protein [Solirubrobacteraceae bacterium]|nr:glycoside hydrolase family 16 protein [Solirubrobacteraceae bacterium]
MTHAHGRPGFALEFEEEFGGDDLDRTKWLPHYLPHWSSRAASAARYEVGGGRLVLRVDRDQPPWCPEFDGDNRVSSLQTGCLAGPVGSAVGQHRFTPAARVREAQDPLRLYTPSAGRVELRCRAIDDPDALVALWMIGFEETPEQSAEVCVMEIFGRDVGEREVRVGVGLHPFGDPTIVDDFEAVPVAIDAREPHTYAAEWGEGRSTFFVDEVPVKVVEQAPDYPLQLMLNVYCLPRAAGAPPRPIDAPALEFEVEYVRGWRPYR